MCAFIRSMKYLMSERERERERGGEREREREREEGEGKRGGNRGGDC